jgi:hypothetical protein
MLYMAYLSVKDGPAVQAVPGAHVDGVLINHSENVALMLGIVPVACGGALNVPTGATTEAGGA